MDGWMDGWMHGWMDGWMETKAGLRYFLAQFKKMLGRHKIRMVVDFVIQICYMEP